MKRWLVFVLLLSGLHADAGTYLYELSWENPASHNYQISLTTEADAGSVTTFSMPLWRPGRYITQDYAAGVSAFDATDESGKPLKWNKTDKDTWSVQNPQSGKITVKYRWYANTLDAGSSYLGAEMAYFNPSNCFMYAGERWNDACTLTVKSMPEEWKAATSLERMKRYNVFAAASYHDFVDSPTILSPTLVTLQKEIRGTQYHFHFQGKIQGDEETEDAFLNGVEKIIQEQVSVFGKAPMDVYHFIYLLVPFNMRHAVEHAYSSCYALPQESMSSQASVSGMFAITSHEFWHLWNVKRIRPAALWPYRYDREQYTSLHWFTEGVTDYYADLIMVRSGLYDRKTFFEQLADNCASLENSAAARFVSPALSSYDSWLAPSSYMNPHLRTSYYPLGHRVGMLIDLKLRTESDGAKSLDDVMRYLMTEYAEKGKGVPEDGVMKAVEAVSGKSWSEFFAQFVDGTAKIPYEKFFQPFGLEWKREKKDGLTWEKIGIERVEKTGFGVYVTSVAPGSDAEKAGVGDKDIIIQINGKEPSAGNVKDAFADLKSGKKIELKLFRDNGDAVVKVEYSGDWEPMRYSLTEKGSPNAKEKKLVDGWLGSLL